MTKRVRAKAVLQVEASKRLDTAAFELEARALGSVNDHPNIVTRHRALVQPGRPPTLVMELCRGSFADRIARTGPLPAREVVSIGVKVCGALETAHRAGILHRDLVPGGGRDGVESEMTGSGEPSRRRDGRPAREGGAALTGGTARRSRRPRPPRP
jgi:hypothetical protein